MRHCQHALVTGASSGIGRALSLELARAGAREIHLLARRRAELATVASEVTALGARAHVMVADVADTEQLVASLRALDERCGGLDLVVANAGVGAAQGADPIAWETLRGPLAVNVSGAAATLTAVARDMARRRRGHLVGIGSISAYAALPGAAAYSAPKAALSMLLDCLRLDLAPHDVAVTHVRLGFVRTAMVLHSTHPMPQLLEADAAARQIVAALARRPREIVLPRALSLLARAAGSLPEALRERMLRRIVGSG